MSDWLCQDCRSVNSPGASNCYRCWTPRRFAEAPDPATLPPGVTPEQAHEERKQSLRPSPAEARSSRRRSWVVIACITATVAFSALNLAYLGAQGGSLGVAISVLLGDWTVVGSLLAISVVGGALALLSAIAWFVWFDRVLANVAPLTGTWPEVGRGMAIVWWLVPIVGQLKGTFVVGHIYGLMAVAGSPGLWLLGLWGVTWLGGTLVPGVVGFIVGWVPLPIEESVHLKDLVSNLGQISYIAAGFFAVALILALEHARDVRASGAGEPAPALDTDLADRLAGQSAQATSPAAWSGTPSPWPAGPDQATGPSQAWSGGADPWPGAADPWSGGADPWPGATDPWPGDADPRPVAPAPPVPHDATPVTRPDGPGDARAPRFGRGAAGRGPVPFEPILVMGALVLAGVVAGITMAGMDDPFGDAGGLAHGPATPGPTLIARPVTTLAPTSAPLASSPPAVGTQPPAVGSRPPVTPTPTTAPRRSAPPTTIPILPTVAPVASPPGSATPTATPVPADLVARRLIATVTDERYRGLMDVAATYIDDTGDTTWEIRLGRVGEREWRLQTITRPDGGSEVVERASLVSSVWERGARTDWVQRRKTDQDRATPPLFDLTATDRLAFRDIVDQDGERLYRFDWDAGDSTLQRFIRDLGAAEGLVVRSGEVLTTDRGVPVRLDLALARGATDDPGLPTLRMTVRYSEVGSDIEVRSPRVGPPLVVRR